MGGDEDSRRASHDSYRSRSSFTIETPELVRKSVDRVRSITRANRFSPRRQDSHGSITSYKSKKTESDHFLDQETKDTEVEAPAAKTIKEIPRITDGLQTSYLLVSPLQGWINTLATMWSARSPGKDSIPENEMKLVIDPTLALYGDDDVFVSIKRLRSWAGKLMGAGKGSRGQFRHREVANAGHFWHDHDALKILQEEVKDFVRGL
jgi:pimeloyl-ACP methyl ester carboxylesterase